MAFIRGAGGRTTIPAQYIYSESSTKLHPLGTALEIDERVFRYALAGEAHVPGKLVQSEVHAGAHATGLAITTAAVGAREVTLTLGATAVLVNDYADGFFWCDAGTNVGHTYKIKSHPAADASATCEFTLYDDLVEALTNGTETGTIARNPYAELIISPSVPTARVMGVPPIDVQDEYYYWLQTWGPCAILTTDTVVIGEHAAVADDDAGAIQAADVANEQIVGTVMVIEADTQYSLVYLTLSP